MHASYETEHTLTHSSLSQLISLHTFSPSSATRQVLTFDFLSAWATVWRQTKGFSLQCTSTRGMCAFSSFSSICLSLCLSLSLSLCLKQSFKEKVEWCCACAVYPPAHWLVCSGRHAKKRANSLCRRAVVYHRIQSHVSCLFVTCIQNHLWHVNLSVVNHLVMCYWCVCG